MKLLLRLVTALCVMPIALLHAQSITISPKNPNVGLGLTQNFTVTVSGLSNKDYTLSVQGAVGGSSTYGTITPTGKYTAPNALPAQNPVTVTATSKSDSSVTTSTYVLLLPPGPKLTQIVPDPLPTGSISLTLMGSGFQTGAQVLDISNGKVVSLSVTSMTSERIYATAYQPVAPSATFTVTNPGTEPSNSITVPVSGGGTTYPLTVVNGTGGGNYTAGQTVTISANPPQSGSSFKNWTGATVANPTAATTTLKMPAASTTVTANYTTPQTYTLTVVSGSGGGNYAPGATVTITANSPPANEVFNDWTGATVSNPNAASTTLTMPSSNTTVTANYENAVTIPYPVTTHPRLWVTPSDVTRLRSWATSTNPIYANGIKPLLTQAVSAYQTQFFPNGVANSNYPDPGDVQGYTGLLTEQYAAVLAFNSLIDPSATNRVTYAKYARNLLMHALTLSAQGPLANAPFRDPAFPIYNRANGSGEQWPLIVDWLYSQTDGLGNAILSASDKATIRKAFLWWANACLNASTTGGDHPEPIGVTNSLQLLPNNQPYRMASNNYYLGHARLLTMMGLAIDPSDDPAIDASQPLSTIGNSLRSYILDANGAWLYQTYAMMGEPSSVTSAYGINGTAGFGLANGGLPPEGMLYGHSFGFVLGQLLALQTAGFNNPAYSGPQINLINAPVWDRYVKGYFSSLTPTAMGFPAEPWLGSVYQFASYGDLLRLYVTPDTMEPFSLLALLEQEQGITTHANAARWFAVNALPGGAGSFMNNITDPWSWSSTDAILYYMLLDPSAQPGTDPRPTFPTTFVDAGQGRIVGHSDWSSTNTMFDYKATWESINHQDCNAGQFELYRKGEWLTKEMSNYDNNLIGFTSLFHNTLCLQNWCPNGTPTNLGWAEGGEWKNGSQWNLGDNAGDPTTLTSSGPGYAFADSNLANLYNRPDVWDATNAAVDVTQATRQILWLNNDYMVTYDRATTNHSGLFKTYNLCFINPPTISGGLTTETTPKGQHLFVNTLLPHNPTIAASKQSQNLSPIAELEPTQYVLTVQDGAKPNDTRFLHVLQAGDAGSTPITATYVTNASGTSFDGAAFGGNAIFFPTNVITTLATTTFNVPTGTHNLFIAGLKPNTAYGVSVKGSSVTLTSTGTGGTTDSAGLLMISL